ncbi:signal peptide peptidase SppA [Roseimicrobium sp. ORNL1]|uniref:signal peptide peptidase SppA n=1 Tax=Roseimicrobium sp. ORNL1 TaxID=2711231 RepID=UPI0013E202DD|nr:signal peptide peptidase SppA [Roseimicrobium sp. ORNL1]QIF04560.1 signal peptide peptidase SppA [Roseimicrobium sp. ORNL1]
MKSKGIGCLIIFLIVALVLSVMFNFVGLVAMVGSVPYVRPKPTYAEVLEQDALSNSKDKIVQIDMEGIIASGSAGGLFSSGGLGVEGVKRALEQAASDSDVRAIVLKVNSPGGEVTASDTLYNAVKEAKKKKPVVVYMDSMAASGGYYLACGASKIVANETTLTGSIGVIIQTLNYSQTFDKVGLQTMTFASGAFKDSLSGSRPMRDDEKAYIQSLVTQMYNKFLGIVSEARGIDIETLKNGIADGRVLTGKEALEKKLVDKVGYVEDAYALAKELSSSANAMVVRYQRSPGLGDIFGALGESQASRGTLKIDVSERLLPRLEAGRMYLLPSHMVP